MYNIKHQVSLRCVNYCGFDICKNFLDSGKHRKTSLSKYFFKFFNFLQTKVQAIVRCKNQIGVKILSMQFDVFFSVCVSLSFQKIKLQWIMLKYNVVHRTAWWLIVSAIMNFWVEFRCQNEKQIALRDKIEKQLATIVYTYDVWRIQSTIQLSNRKNLSFIAMI